MNRGTFRALAIAAVSMITIGCSSTGVLQVNPNEYMVSATGTSPAFTGTEDALKKVYVQANKHCAAQSRDVRTVSLDKVEQRLGRAGRATLNFECVEKK